MMQPGWVGLLGSVAFGLVVWIGPAFAVPSHEADATWGKGGHHGKDMYDGHGKHGHHGHSGKASAWGGSDKYWGDDLKKIKDYKYLKSYKYDDGYQGKKCGYYQDCDPPVAVPEPTSLLLIGSTLVGVGMYTRHRRYPRGGIARRGDGHPGLTS
jgi:hypothetical protein